MVMFGGASPEKTHYLSKSVRIWVRIENPHPLVCSTIAWILINVKMINVKAT
jgi:hypothetical protein